MTKLDKLRTMRLILNIVSTANKIINNIDPHVPFPNIHFNTPSYTRKKCKSCKKFNDSHDCSYAKHSACKNYIPKIKRR